MRNCLALMGIIFLVLLILGAVLLYTADPQLLQELRQEGASPELDVIITPFGAPEIQNIATPALLPSPTALPDAVAYQARVLIRLRQFAAALDAFMQANQRLQADNRLMNAPPWRSEVQAALDELVLSAHSLSGFSAVPPEYAAIAAWLDQVGPEADRLRASYLQGVQTGDQALLGAAGENLTRITEIMQQAQVEMAAAGWQP